MWSIDAENVQLLKNCNIPMLFPVTLHYFPLFQAYSPLIHLFKKMLQDSKYEHDSVKHA